MHRTIGVGILVAISSAALALPPLSSTRAASDWTIDERLTQRFDRERIQERNLAYRPAGAAVQSQSIAAVTDDGDGSKPLFRYVVDGQRNPELFLPHELFDLLLSGLTPDESLRVKQRAFYQASLRRLGYDDTAFWNALASVNGEYVLIKFSPSQSQFGSTASMQAVADSRCRARFTALEAARRLFGRAAFDRLLYTVVAPTARTSAAGFDPHPEVALRRAEEGCH